jgi:anti-sigma regulatory factor (Ser/Thr protein kinase)
MTTDSVFRVSASAPAAAHASLELGAVLTAPGCARAWTREIIGEWRLNALVSEAELVVSELITNSVNASRSLVRSVIGLRLTYERGELAILVRDHCPGAPQVRHPATAEDVDGRGLLLVEALSARHGWYPLEGDIPGKVIWVVLPAGRTPVGSLSPRPSIRSS